jgi:5-methyltetrahydrofolate--homocysteine methyltransferase
MSDLEEVRAAVEGSKSVSDLPIAATMTFDTHGRTMMGVTPAKALSEMISYGLAALGANCGNGPAEIEEVIQTMRSLNKDVILIAKSNAGIPQWINETLIYDGTPEVMGEYAKRVYSLGAQLIGGCCGSSPAHIKAMADALKGDIPIVTTAVPAAMPPKVNKPGRERRHRRQRRD